MCRGSADRYRVNLGVKYLTNYISENEELKNLYSRCYSPVQ